MLTSEIRKRVIGVFRKARIAIGMRGVDGKNVVSTVASLCEKFNRPFMKTTYSIIEQKFYSVKFGVGMNRVRNEGR